jgi:hypothetical protein
VCGPGSLWFTLRFPAGLTSSMTEDQALKLLGLCFRYATVPDIQVISCCRDERAPPNRLPSCLARLQPLVFATLKRISQIPTDYLDALVAADLIPVGWVANVARKQVVATLPSCFVAGLRSYCPLKSSVKCGKST